MKLLNKKGFMMVESLIVTTFVLALFIVVYRNVIPQMGEYDKMFYYDDIDSVYASNILKNMITRYANTNYIDVYLQNNTYIELMDCDNKNLYVNSDYCKIIMKNLEITDKDYIFITKYNISNFRNTVKTQDKFDSGNLSNFRDYINTVANEETFYSKKTNDNIIGKYRLFITRTVTESDQSTTRRFVNIGIYTGTYQKYIMGDTVTFNPGDGNKTFYVLKNSDSTDSTVTLILANNLPSSNTTFNSTNTPGIPDTVLAKLQAGTSNWTNVDKLNNIFYNSFDGYKISYSDYRARLLDENDIYQILGCKANDQTCFDFDDAFAKDYSSYNLEWLHSNLNDNTGYWTAATIPNSGSLAWSIQNGKIEPTELNETVKQIGVRPVITISKDKLN